MERSRRIGSRGRASRSSHERKQRLPRQIEELRRQADELRRQLPAPLPSSEGKSDDPRAFTLLELLVVVGVLGILASFLFPALSQAKSQARLTRCKANLSQLGKALIMYEGEEGKYPGAGLPFQGSNWSLTRTDDSWDMRLFAFVSKNTNLFTCPSNPPHFEGSIKVDDYGYNAGGSSQIYDFSQNLGLGFGMTNGSHRAVRGSDVRSPSDMIALGDLQTPPSLWVNIITPNVPRPLGNLDRSQFMQKDFATIQRHWVSGNAQTLVTFEAYSYICYMATFLIPVAR